MSFVISVIELHVHKFDFDLILFLKEKTVSKLVSEFSLNHPVWIQ